MAFYKKYFNFFFTTDLQSDAIFVFVAGQKTVSPGHIIFMSPRYHPDKGPYYIILYYIILYYIILYYIILYYIILYYIILYYIILYYIILYYIILYYIILYYIILYYIILYYIILYYIILYYIILYYIILYYKYRLSYERRGDISFIARGTISYYHILVPLSRANYSN